MLALFEIATSHQSECRLQSIDRALLNNINWYAHQIIRGCPFSQATHNTADESKSDEECEPVLPSQLPSIKGGFGVVTRQSFLYCLQTNMDGEQWVMISLFYVIACDNIMHGKSRALEVGIHSVNRQDYSFWSLYTGILGLVYLGLGSWSISA